MSDPNCQSSLLPLAGSLFIASIVCAAEAIGLNGVGLPLCAIAMCAWLLCRHASGERDYLAMSNLLAATIVVLYIARPLYVLSHHRYGAAAKVDDRFVSAAVHDSLERTLFLCALGVAMLVAGYIAGAGGVVHDERIRVSDHSYSVTLPRGRLLFITACSVALAVFSLLFLIKSSGGIGAYLAGLSNKGQFLYGKQWLILARLPLKGVFLACCVVAAVHRERGRYNAFILPLGLGVLLSEFLSGGRAGLILGCILPVSLLFHYLSRPIPFLRLLLIAGVAGVGFLGIRVVTRDSVFANPNRESTLSLLASSIRNYPDATIGGTDAVPFDSFLTLVDRSNPTGLPLGGRTYITSLSAPIPRALWSGKPDGGGNTWFTSTYYPRFYLDGHVETSLSLFGELWANFGRLGLGLGAFIFGLALGRLYRWMRGGTIQTLLVYGVIAGCGITAIRGDAYQTVANLIGATVTAGIALAVLKSESSSWVRAAPDVLQRVS